MPVHAAVATLLAQLMKQPLHGPRVALLLARLLPPGLVAAIQVHPSLSLVSCFSAVQRDCMLLSACLPLVPLVMPALVEPLACGAMACLGPAQDHAATQRSCCRRVPGRRPWRRWRRPQRRPSGCGTATWLLQPPRRSRTWRRPPASRRRAPSSRQLLATGKPFIIWSGSFQLVWSFKQQDDGSSDSCPAAAGHGV